MRPNRSDEPSAPAHASSNCDHQIQTTAAKKIGPDLEEYEREMDEEGLEFGGLTYAEERAGRRSAEARRSTNSDYWWRTAVRQD